MDFEKDARLHHILRKKIDRVGESDSRLKEVDV
jgi:hypothetical protein